jgi:hypothetical protein
MLCGFFQKECDLWCRLQHRQPEQGPSESQTKIQPQIKETISSDPGAYYKIVKFKDLTLLFGSQIVSAYLDIPGIAWYAHIGGFIFGFGLMFGMRKLNYL